MPGSISPTYREGAATPGSYPILQSAVLQSVAAVSGIASPVSLSATATILNPRTTTVLVGPNTGRTFLLIYNPTQVPAQISKGTATYGAITNLAIGPGQACFMSSQQGLAPVYQGGMTAISAFGTVLWVWEDARNIYNDSGVLAFHTAPAGWPISPIGLPPGSVWNNGLTVGVVTLRDFGPPGDFDTDFGPIPDPAAPPLFFGSITADQLLLLGGGNLPTSNPGPGTLQLWNDLGIVSIA